MVAVRVSQKTDDTKDNTVYTLKKEKKLEKILTIFDDTERNVAAKFRSPGTSRLD